MGNVQLSERLHIEEFSGFIEGTRQSIIRQRETGDVPFSIARNPVPATNIHIGVSPTRGVDPMCAVSCVIQCPESTVLNCGVRGESRKKQP